MIGGIMEGRFIFEMIEFYRLLADHTRNVYAKLEHGEYDDRREYYTGYVDCLNAVLYDMHDVLEKIFMLPREDC